MTDLVYTFVPSPLGRLRLVASADAVVGLYFPEHKPTPRFPGAVEGRTPLLERAAGELDAWLAGQRRDFTVPLDPRGTPFQRRVWAQLARIPYGETRSYQALAQAIDAPGASRAVGAANSRNPLSLFLPCHRVVTSSGALGGYAGGLDAKRWLLAHERITAGRPGLAAPRGAPTTPAHSRW
ncbi:MAG: methylated-DNA--[protein]-cysteine S-methyltransferase [Alphaproteobacteria bacterium]|nr:methylated-DNA--[protein]-cysteine S-methyltransferase [Alphaproteobacteria bacterium]